jgi:hypothetical protein
VEHPDRQGHKDSPDHQDNLVHQGKQELLGHKVQLVRLDLKAHLETLDRQAKLDPGETLDLPAQLVRGETLVNRALKEILDLKDKLVHQVNPDRRAHQEHKEELGQQVQLDKLVLRDPGEM